MLFGPLDSTKNPINDTQKGNMPMTEREPIVCLYTSDDAPEDMESFKTFVINPATKYINQAA